MDCTCTFEVVTLVFVSVIARVYVPRGSATESTVTVDETWVNEGVTTVGPLKATLAIGTADERVRVNVLRVSALTVDGVHEITCALEVSVMKLATRLLVSVMSTAYVPAGSIRGAPVRVLPVSMKVSGVWVNGAVKRRTTAAAARSGAEIEMIRVVESVSLNERGVTEETFKVENTVANDASLPNWSVNTTS
jgi:hypothetical protein